MHRTQTVCLVILTTIAVGFSLFYLKSVLLPFVIALFVVIGCRPVLSFFETRLNLNRYVSFAVAFSIGTLLLIGFGLMIWLSINDLRRNSDSYEARLNTIAKWVGDRMLEQKPANEQTKTEDPQTPIRTDSPAEMDLEPNDEELRQNVVDDLEMAAEDAKKAIAEFFNSASLFLQSQLLNVAGSLSTLLSYGVLILIFVFFLLMGQESHQQPPEIIRQIEEQVRRYLVMKTVISAVTGFAFGFVLWLFGVPLALLFGFLAFLLNYIPNIGPLIGTILPVPFLVLNSEMEPTWAIVCFLLVVSIQFISGNVIETRIMGQSFDVSPVVLLLALMFFGLVWGIIGMFLATPIVSIAKIILQQHETTKPLSELMAGRWITSETTATA